MFPEFLCILGNPREKGILCIVVCEGRQDGIVSVKQSLYLDVL